jgi:PAS domain S-box-containing protein
MFSFGTGKATPDRICLTEPPGVLHRTMNHRLPLEASRLNQIEAGLDLLDQGITVFDANLKLIAWNKPFLELLEFPAELTYLGADFDAFIRFNALRGEYGEGDIDVLIQSRVSAAKNFQPHCFERMRPNGRIIRVHGEPLPDRGFITLYTDITEQRRFEKVIQDQNSELEQRVTQRTSLLEQVNKGLVDANNENLRITEALRRSEGQLRLITDTIPALIAYFDGNRIYRYANRGYCEWFNKSVEEVVGESIDDIIGVRALESVKHHIAQALSGEQVSYEYAMLQNGIKVHARSILVPEFNPEGIVIGCFVLSFDITEQKRLQAALIQAQKMEAIGQLSSGIAHDFNNLLTIIIGNLNLLVDKTANDPELRELAIPAIDAGKRGAQLIQRLLSFSRQQPLKPKVIDIKSLIQDITPLLDRSLPSRIKLEISLGPIALVALIDAHQLENALLNLVVNARDAIADSGSIQINASISELDESDAQELDVQVGKYIKIQVKDDGIGMEQEIVSRIFEPFFTTKDFGRGSGLGLAMTYGFVKQSGGGILVQSDPGNGTMLTIVLPSYEASLEETWPNEPEQPDVRRDGQLVLLVEDDAAVREVVRKQLMELGHPVIEAVNATEAIKLISQVQDIAIVLTDVIMPGSQTGREMAISAIEQKPHLHIVIMSGYEDLTKSESDTRNFTNLSKPFTKKQLASALGKA